MQFFLWPRKTLRKKRGHFSKSPLLFGYEEETVFAPLHPPPTGFSSAHVLLGWRQKNGHAQLQIPAMGTLLSHYCGRTLYEIKFGEAKVEPGEWIDWYVAYERVLSMPLRLNFFGDDDCICPSKGYDM